MVEIGASVLSDANHVTAPITLRDVDQKTMAGFLGQKPKTDDLPT
jgi:hypothetical protein